MHLYDLLAGERLVSLTSLLVSSFAKASVILLIGTACSMLARGASAAARHMIWSLTLAGALAAPVVSMVVPRWTVPMVRWPLPAAPVAFEPVIVPAALTGASSNAVLALAPRAESASAATEAVGPSAEPVRRSSGVAVSTPATARAAAWSTTTSASGSTATPTIASRTVTATPEPATATAATTRHAVLAATAARPGTWRSVAPWLVVLWALGVVVALVPTLIALARLSVVARRARPMRGGRWALLVPSVMRELDVRRHVRFVELDGPVMPMTWGLFRPIVLLPVDEFNSTIEQRLDVLRHELAHVRRYDCLTQLVGQIACAVHWFNPLAWLAARELKVERERACDDEVLRAGARASDYADYLLRVAGSTRIVCAAALGGLAMARPSQMAGRLLAVLDDRRRRDRVSRLLTVHASALAVVLVAGVASASPVKVQRREASVATPAVAAAAPRAERIATVEAAPPVLPTEPNEPVAPGAVPEAAGPRMAPATAPAAELAAPLLPTPVWNASSAVAAPASVIHAYMSPTAAAPCDRTARRESGSHSNWTSSDNGAKSWRVMWSEGDCQYEILARGEVKYNRDVTDVESISSGGMFSLEQHVGDDTKRIVIRPRDDGTLDRTYTVNGARQEYDAAAKAWFAEALVALDRQTAFAADQRVPAILERGGVDAVLQEITFMGSDYARRRYYTKLLSMRQLDRGQIKRVVEQAGADMSSDYELAELLVAVSKVDAFGDDSYAAFVAAVKKIDSDYERRRALNALLQRDRLAPTTVAALLDAASSIDSDYELAELLIDVSKKYAIDDATRPTYIKALGSIQSDYEHRRVLSAIVAGGGLTPAVTRTMLEDARRIGSDYELAEFLILMAKKGGLDASTRDAYFAAADKIKSDYEHHRVLSPLLARDLLTKDIAKAVLTSAAKIDSDYECAQLLVEVANAIPIDDDLRPAFERAADTIQGEYEYGRAMGAVRRRVTR